MNIQNNTNFSFKGYDALPLKALYMQGIRSRGTINIFREMKSIAEKEGLDLFLNQDGMTISRDYTHKTVSFMHISIWGQDVKAFVLNKFGKTVLWNENEPLLLPEASLPSGEMPILNDYKVYRKKYFPRGGNYYLGYKPNGEKWIIMNAGSIATQESFKKNKDLPTVEHIYRLFDIKPENLYTLNAINDDLDEIIRPIGFPYILVNDYKESLKNLEKMKQKFPQSYETYGEIRKYLSQNVNQETMPENLSADEICQKLEEWGFKPIKIGGRYIDDINYINALAFENKDGKISYITNSATKSYPELVYLERLFDEDLRAKVKDITKTYYVSGGKRTEQEKNSESFISMYSKGLKNRNVIMDILANRRGGIHCMTAEIPAFDTIQARLLNTII